MKYGKKCMFVACAALLLGMQSCDLEEYNPCLLYTSDAADE